jgi:hypothetical protein
MDVTAVPKAVNLTTSKLSVFIAGVAPGAGVAVDLGLTHLFVKVCVSVVPTTVPDGAVTVVKADVPFPRTRPVNVPAPLPPRDTASVPVHPTAMDDALTNAVVGLPPNVSVTFVSSVLVSAAPATVGDAHVASPRQNVELLALVPLLRFATGRFPVTPFERSTCAHAGLFDDPVFER